MCGETIFVQRHCSQRLDNGNKIRTKIRTKFARIRTTSHEFAQLRKKERGTWWRSIENADTENSFRVHISDDTEPPSDDDMYGLPALTDEVNGETEENDDYSKDNVGELSFDSEGRVQHPRLRNFETNEVDELLKCGNNNCIATNYFGFICLLAKDALPPSTMALVDICDRLETEFSNVYQFYNLKEESLVILRGYWPPQLKEYVKKQKSLKPSQSGLDHGKSSTDRCTDFAGFSATFVMLVMIGLESGTGTVAELELAKPVLRCIDGVDCVDGLAGID